MDVASQRGAVWSGQAHLRPLKLVDVKPFTLGSVEIYPATRRILIGGAEQLVEPKVMLVLVTMAQARGQVLSTDDLLDSCWDGRIVSDAAIYRIISKIHTLARDSDGSFMLENVAKVGYRLVAPQMSDLVGAHDGCVDEAEAKPHTRRWLLAGGAGFALAATVGWWVNRRDPSAERVQQLLVQAEQTMRNGSSDTLRQGVGFLEEAVRLEPRNARAWGILALARAFATEAAPPEVRAKMVQATEAAAARAKALDPRQVDAHSAMALLPHYFGDWWAAEQRFNAVLRIDPHHRPTLDAKHFFLIGVGRVREGCRGRFASINDQTSLDAGFQYRLVYSYWLMGMIGDADRTAERALQLWPRHPGCWLARLLVLLNTGRADRALMLVNNAASRPDFPAPMVAAFRGVTAALISGAVADRALAVELLIRLLVQGPVFSIIAVALLNSMGETATALDVAEGFLAETGPIMAEVRWNRGNVALNDSYHRKTHMLFLPNAAMMRRNQRFAALVERIGMARYWQQAGIVPDHLA